MRDKHSRIMPYDVRIEPADGHQAPLLQSMAGGHRPKHMPHMEDTPAYAVLLRAGLLTTKYRKASFEHIFFGDDLAANSSKLNDLKQMCFYGVFCCPLLGCALYRATHVEMFIPAGHVGLMLDERQRYLFAQPGMHNVASCFMKHVGTQSVPQNSLLCHGNRAILCVEQGFIGMAFDNGQPVLFPPGIHVYKSETLKYHSAIPLDQNVVRLGPYTLLTVDEGYAAVTQSNGKQHVLMGGQTWLLDHKNWRFEKFITLKVQTADLERIQATSADNIVMEVTSTVTWRIVDPELAATMGLETMALSQKVVSSDMPKLRQDVQKQAIASLASFMGGVNYSDSFHMAAVAQQGHAIGGDGLPEPEAESIPRSCDNPIYDAKRMTSATPHTLNSVGAAHGIDVTVLMQSLGFLEGGLRQAPHRRGVVQHGAAHRVPRAAEAVSHANRTTRSYGVEILSINILSAVPVDAKLTRALACGAVASAEALQAETAARGKAKATRINAEAKAEKARIEANGEAEAAIIQASAQGEAARLVAEGNKKAADLLATSEVAVELAKVDKSAGVLGRSDKFFFGQEPAYFANLVLKGIGAVS